MTTTSNQQGNLSIVVQVKHIYGNESIYPHCAKAKLFAKLLSQRTLTRGNLDVIKQLGYEVRVFTPVTQL